MATINDICKMVGVSTATVSRAINGTGQVKESTRQAIFSAMEQLNYRPSYPAQALASKTGNNIGLVLSDFEGHYFSQLLKEATRVADKTGKQLIVTDGHNEVDREKQAIYSLVDRRCDVIVVYTKKMSEEEMIAVQQEVGLPIIYLGRTLPAGTGYAVSFNQKQSTRVALEHLLSQGHRQIAYFGPQPVTPTAIQRLETWLEVIKENALPWQDNWYQSSEFSLEGGYQAAKHFMAADQHCSAIFTACDIIAVGAMHAFDEAGIALPETFAIASIDDEKLASYISPSLTSVYLPVNCMIQHAMNTAIQLMDGVSVPFESKVFDGILKIRRSSSKRMPK